MYHGSSLNMCNSAGQGYFLEMSEMCIPQKGCPGSRHAVTTHAYSVIPQMLNEDLL